MAGSRQLPSDDPVLHGLLLAGAIFILAMANFMAILDTTIVNVAVPHIAGALAVSPHEGTWVITSYAVAEAVTVPLSGWLAARFGAVRVFAVSAIAFGLFSALCGFATSLPMLVLFRVLQGLAGGPLMPMSQTLLLRVAPPERANMAMGLWMMTTIIAPIAGPVLGGTMSDTIGWEWAFYINVPFSVICGVVGFQMLRTRETSIVKNPVDFVGLIFLIVFVGSLQVMLDNGQNEDWFASSFIRILAVTAVLGFVAFLIWELTDEHPIVNLRVFRHPGFAMSTVAMALTFGSFFASVVLIPLWLQTNMGYTATWAGYVLAFQGILGVCMAPVAAMLVSRFDPRLLMSVGLAMLSYAILMRTGFAQNMTFGQLVLPQALMGFMPFFFMPLMTMAMGSVEREETASASGLVNFTRTMSGAFGTALATSAWTSATADSRAELVGVLNDPAAVIQTMQQGGLTPDQALHAFDNMVQGQAVMLATNHMFLIIGLIVAVTAVGVWFMPRPTGLAQGLPAGGH
ncbi:MAG: DHA2 family efflux MFS transporter permease subunit [Alphaproteobacteria bacterium]|nr:DHA2 family efflux MFS transporter permease subunit [Alphaproteobacteria bacterium]